MQSSSSSSSTIGTTTITMISFVQHCMNNLAVYLYSARAGNNNNTPSTIQQQQQQQYQHQHQRHGRGRYRSNNATSHSPQLQQLQILPLRPGVLPMLWFGIIFVTLIVIQYRHDPSHNDYFSLFLSSSSSSLTGKTTTHYLSAREKRYYSIVQSDEFFYRGPSQERLVDVSLSKKNDDNDDQHQNEQEDIIQQPVQLFYEYNHELYLSLFYDNNDNRMNEDMKIIESTFSFQPLSWTTPPTRTTIASRLPTTLLVETERTNHTSSSSSVNNVSINSNHSTTGNRNVNDKLIFIHTTRSAGWTIRSLLHTYTTSTSTSINKYNYNYANATIRKKNISLLSIQRCYDLHFTTMNSTDIWSNGRYYYNRIHGAPIANTMDCIGTIHTKSQDHYKNSRVRVNDPPPTNTNTGNQYPMSIVDQISSDFIMNHSIDILSGQVPIGCHEYWYNTNENSNDNNNDINHGPINYQQQSKRVHAKYVIFFRHPFYQFISEFISRKGNTITAFNKNSNLNNSNDTVIDIISDEMIIQMIRSTIIKANKMQLYYEPRSSHALITPQQMFHLERIPSMVLYPERRMNISKMNLLQYTLHHSIMIGIVERMEESIHMLQYILDPYNQSYSIFQPYYAADVTSGDDISNNTSNNNNTVLQQLIDSRTNSIVQKIQCDREYIVLRSMIEEYIKYENQVYNLALQIHDRQYKWWYTTNSNNNNIKPRL